MIWALACQRIPPVSRFCNLSLDPLGELVSIGQRFLWWSWFNRFMGLVDPQESQWILGGSHIWGPIDSLGGSGSFSGWYIL